MNYVNFNHVHIYDYNLFIYDMNLIHKLLYLKKNLT